MTSAAWRDLVRLTWGLLLAATGILLSMIEPDLGVAYGLFLSLGLLLLLLASA